MKLVNILAGSPQLPDLPIDFTNDVNWIGVDRGSLTLLEHGIIPTLAVGDFDSMSEDELRRVKNRVGKIIQVDPVKDDTDTELALSQAFEKYHANFVNLYGISGGRLDHFLSNFLMVLKPRFNQYAQKIKMIDQQNIIRFFKPGHHQIQAVAGYKYLSFITLGAVHELTLPDEKYRLQDQIDPYPTAYVSNEFVQPTANFSFTSGTVAVIYSRDLKKEQ